MSAPVTFTKKVAASDMKLAATWWRRGVFRKGFFFIFSLDQKVYKALIFLAF